jgi:fructose-1,6-bisphosphatase/inositol monophosphatase family enzyme
VSASPRHSYWSTSRAEVSPHEPLSTAAVLELMQAVAAEVITPRFRSLADSQIDEKKPGDLVTVADREAEELITRALLEAYPDAVVLGEEAYHEDADLLPRFRAADHGFTVDPVDGTKNFVNGSPDHAVMVSEVADGETVRGWIWQPEHELAWVAERGAGVRRNGETITREPAGEQPQGATSIWSRRGRQPEGLPALKGTWVCCGVDYPKLIEGEADYILYGHTFPWDHLPGTLMVREAGGAAAHRDGTPYTARSGGAGLIVASDPDTLERARAACEGLWPNR